MRADRHGADKHVQPVPRSSVRYTRETPGRRSCERHDRHTGTMPSTEFHPDLRRIARLAPRGLVGPKTLQLVRGVIAGVLRGSKPVTTSRRSSLGSGVGVRLHRPTGVSQPAAGAAVDPWRRLCASAMPSRTTRLVRSVRPRVWYHRRGGGLSAGPRASLSRAAGGLLCGADLVGGVCPRSTRLRVAIGGASAGAGLAAALALMARDRGEITPILQVLAYPMLDDRSGAGPKNPNYRRGAEKQSLRVGGLPRQRQPAGRGSGRREDLSGLPPAWIGVGTHDLFHDEDVAYAERLTAAGYRATSR